jgi:hypothetical protein
VSAKTILGNKYRARGNNNSFEINIIKILKKGAYHPKQMVAFCK